MYNYHNLPSEASCTGCAACMNICPSTAIMMKLNDEGFYKPFIDGEKCTSCGLCEKRCPVLHTEYINNPLPDCYALMAQDDIRLKSSSGGAFQILAEIILEKKGAVCGAAYSDGYRKVNHIIIDNKDELYKLRGSKYIMSDMNKVYSEIKEHLLRDRFVLFCGVPCEVAGLNSFLGQLKNSQFLLTVDLICHGIPSVKAFENYIRDCHRNRSIKHLGFKDKEYGWHGSMTIRFDDDSLYNCPSETDDFLRSYLNGVNKNSCCGSCHFATIPRQGDITIGDYWGINNVNPEYNDKIGTSVLLINSERAKNYSQEIKNRAKLFEQTPIEGAIKGNSNLISSPKTHISRNQFFRNLDNRHFPDLVRWAVGANRFDVGIVGIPIFPNFGGALTYYALYRTLTDCGCSVALFSRPRSTGKMPIPPEMIYTVNPYDKGGLMLDYRDKEAMSTAGNLCESFVVGSDQLFNADLYKSFGEIVTLDWISDNHRKIAYAASFGHNYFWGDEHQRAKMAHYMQKFDAFSVRETDAVSLAKNTFGVEAEWVLDPVFLCDKKHYIKLAEMAVNQYIEPHIFAYILDPDDNKNEIIRTCSEKLNLPIELYSEMLFNPSEEQISAENARFGFPLRQGNVNDRLHSLINSNFIIADSFHGVCFAIIFEIPFIAILNPLRGASRFYSVLGKLDLLDHLVVDNAELLDKIHLVRTDATFKESMKLLDEERSRCIDWLLGALYPRESIKKSYSDVDIIDEKIKSIKKDNIVQELKLNAVMSGCKLYSHKNIFSYIDELKKNIHNFIIFVSVKDTPGYNFTPLMQRKIETLDLNKSLVNKHWHSYVAVIDGGKVISEQISVKDERVAYVGKIGGLDVKVVSRSYNQGNVSAVFINGIDYSENKRGINFVIYDKRMAEVIDSVCFDTHSENIIFYRFGKAHHSVMEPYMNCELLQPVKGDVIPSKEFPKSNLDVFYCCRLAAEKAANRKIVLWGKNELFCNILKQFFDISVENEYDDKSLDGLVEISGRQNDYFIIAPNKKFDNADIIQFKNLGYVENKDLLYRHIRPIILKNRDYGKEPYCDIYGNQIVGNFTGPSKIILRGYNISITLGDNCTFGGDALLSIDTTENARICLGNRVRFIGETAIAKMNDKFGTIICGNSINFICNQIRLFADFDGSSIIVKDKVTFNTGTCLHCNAGKKITIGEDVMFSLNVRVMCGDAHSLFDVKTGQNTNSIPSCLSARQNEVIIGDHVWVGINSTILSGSIIGNGSVIGANALVKGAFPNNCVIGGNPAKQIKRDVAWSRKNCSTNIEQCNMQYVQKTSDVRCGISKNVLVLGGTRFMGIRLVQKLIEENHFVTIANRGTREDSFGNSVNRIYYDRSDEESIKTAFAGKKYDVVIDTSAYDSLSVKNILDNLECTKYIQVSSVAVYPNHHLELHTEEFDSNIEKYSIGVEKEYYLGKRNSECVALQEYKSLQSIIVRIPFVVEPDNLDNQDLNLRLFFYVQKIMTGIPINVDNLDYCCSFVRTTEEADFLAFLMDVDYTGIINFSSEGYVKVGEIIDYIERKSGHKAIIKQDGILHPFNAKHFGYSGYSLNLDEAKSLQYKMSDLNSWLWNLLDTYIGCFQ